MLQQLLMPGEYDVAAHAPSYSFDGAAVGSSAGTVNISTVCGTLTACKGACREAHVWQRSETATPSREACELRGMACHPRGRSSFRGSACVSRCQERRRKHR